MSKVQVLTVGEVFSKSEIAEMDLISVVAMEDVSESVRDHDRMIEDFELIAGFSEEEAIEAASNVALYDEAQNLSGYDGLYF